MSNRKKPDTGPLIRAAERIIQMSLRHDPLVTATARTLLHRIKMTPMRDILEKVPGETWIEKAKNVGVSRVTLHGWLTGRCRPYPEQAKRLADLTGYDAVEIRGTRSR